MVLLDHHGRATEAPKWAAADVCRAHRGLLGGAGYHCAAGALLIVYNRDILIVSAETLARLGRG